MLVPEKKKVAPEILQQNKAKCEHLQTVIKVYNGKINKLMDRAEKIREVNETLKNEL